VKRCLILTVLIALAACQPQPLAGVVTPDEPLFPTMTPGRVLRGPLPTVIALPLDGGLSNPATAVALANRPTATPNLSACPAADPALVLEGPPVTSVRELDDAVARFLSAGGTVQALETALRERWGVLGAEGVVRGDLDLTGEGVPEVIITVVTPGEGGSLLIFGCFDGRYLPRYQALIEGATAAPALLNTVDINVDGLPDLLFSAEVCAGGACQYETGLVTWSRQLGRFISLLEGPLRSEAPPVIQDVDGDRVGELVVRFDNPGNAQTGPLRTGVTIYDWNGIVYTRAITQLNPPRFRIQVIHQADEAFAAGAAQEAIALYNLALDSPALENWHNNDAEVLRAYALYRLLLAYADTGDRRLVETHQTVLQNYSDFDTAPVYAALSIAFWNAFQTSNNLRSACAAVQDIIQARPEALTLLNRYGSRSPTYAPATLCPF
jgi:hypothetical protein